MKKRRGQRKFTSIKCEYGSSHKQTKVLSSLHWRKKNQKKIINNSINIKREIKHNSM